jgi:hypothetical protein
LGLAAPCVQDRHDGSDYRRHRPEETVLYRLVEAHWPAFRARVEESGSLPRFVVSELDEYLRCGRLEYGCLRIACSDCGFERLVAFSCRRRGFCPSCLGRRMADTAVHLVARVLPEVRIRQWVCSLPWRLRALLGYDRRLAAAVLRVFVGEVARSLQRRAKQRLGLKRLADAKIGAVTFIQRFDSGLRLNVHFHTLFLDGVYVRDPERGALVFHELPEPTLAEVEEVARRTAGRVAVVLRKHGRALGDELAHPLAHEPALADIYGAAVRGIELLGERPGKPTLRIVDPEAARAGEPAADVAGFNIHAKVVVDGRDRARLERVCRYLGRPPIAKERLQLLPDGRVRYLMKKPWRDGTRAIVLSPLDLIARLCAMVPPPGFHMIRFHGVFAGHAADRAEVVPRPEPEAESSAAPPKQLAFAGIGEEEDVDAAEDDERAPSRKHWAWLLRHVFKIDVTVCPFCEGRMRWLEVATRPDDIARLLAREGLGPRPPPPPSPRRRRRRTPFEQLALALDLDVGVRT